MEETKRDIAERTILGAFSRGLAEGTGIVAVFAAVVYFVPGVQDTITQIATSCFG